MGKVIDFNQAKLQLQRKQGILQLTSEEFLFVAEQVNTCGDLLDLIDATNEEKVIYDNLSKVINKSFDEPHTDEECVVHYEITEDELERMKDFICSYL